MLQSYTKRIEEANAYSSILCRGDRVKYLVGIDIGGTNTVIGLFNRDLDLIDKTNVPTLKSNFPQKTSNPTDFFDLLVSEIKALVSKFGSIEQLNCVGIGVPGKVDSQTGVALGAVNLGYVNVPFANEMAERLHVPVFIDNDVRNYTRGEAFKGKGSGYSNLICLTLGTGLAAGVMVDGKVISGYNNYAGEIGHDTIIGETSLCNCGKHGCLETVASASGITRLAKKAIKAGHKTVLYEKPDDQLTSFDVYLASLQGDKVAINIFDYVGRVLATKLVTLTFLLNPEAIIIGGGAASAGDFLLNPIKEVFHEYYGVLNEVPIITTGSLGDSAGLYGSAHLALSRKKDKGIVSKKGSS